MSTTSRHAPHFVDESPEVVVGILEEAHLDPEPLGVERPPFDERGGASFAPEERLLAELLRERDLQVMAGNGLVQGERDHFVDRPRLERVGVRKEESRRPTRERAGLVVGGRLRRRHEARDLAHSVREARKRAEELGKMSIDALADVAIALQEALRILVIEAGIGAQEGGEGLEERVVSLRGGRLRRIGLEPWRAPDHLEHFGADPRHFAQSERMDLLGGERQRRLLPQAPRVERGAVGQIARADRGAARGQVLVAEESTEVVERPRDRGNGRLRVLRERYPLGARHRVGHPQHRFEELRQTALRDGRTLGRDALDRDLRRDHSALHAESCHFAMRLEHGRDRAESGEIVAKVLRRPEGNALVHLRDLLVRSMNRSDREEPGSAPMTLDRQSHLVDEEQTMDSILLVEELRVDALGPDEEALELPGATLGGGGGGIRQAIGARRLAASQRLLGKLVVAEAVVRLEELMEGAARRGAIRVGARRRRVRRSRARGRR